MKIKFVVLFVLLVFATSASASLTTPLGSDADTYMREWSATYGGHVRGPYTFMDVRGGANDFAGYLRFDLSGLGAGITIESATLTLINSGNASRNDKIVTGRFALYGLNNVAGNTPQNWVEVNSVSTDGLSEDANNKVGAEWNGVVPLSNVGTRVTDLDDNVAGITETIVIVGDYGVAGSTTVTVTGDPLVAFLQGRVGDGGLVTFIIANDDSGDRGYGLATKENATESYRPKLELTYTPEPATIALLGLGALSLLRRKRA